MRIAFLAFVLCHTVLAPTQALAAFPCDELWGERNAVYAEAGYCFRTPRGIKASITAGLPSRRAIPTRMAKSLASLGNGDFMRRDPSEEGG